MNVLLNFTISVAFCVKLATLSNFEKVHDYFGTPHLFLFKKKNNFWTFWEILLIQSHSTANLLILVILKKFKIFWKNPSIFSERDPKFEHFEKSVAFYGIFATFIVFWLNSSFFPGRTHLLLKKQQTLNVLLNLTISVAFYGKLATLSNLKKFTFCFSKSLSFYLEKTQFLNVLRNLTISWALNGNFATLSDFEKKFKILFWKKRVCFCLKKPKNWAFWEVSRILRRFCYL